MTGKSTYKSVYFFSGMALAFAISFFLTTTANAQQYFINTDSTVQTKSASDFDLDFRCNYGVVLNEIQARIALGTTVPYTVEINIDGNFFASTSVTTTAVTAYTFTGDYVCTGETVDMTIGSPTHNNPFTIRRTLSTLNTDYEVYNNNYVFYSRFTDETNAYSWAVTYRFYNIHNLTFATSTASVTDMTIEFPATTTVVTQFDDAINTGVLFIVFFLIMASVILVFTPITRRSKQ